MRALIVTAVLMCLVGCDAHFKDLRGSVLPTPDAGPADAGHDSGSSGDAATDGAPTDAGSSDSGSAETEVARGSWEGESGYNASGTVALVQVGASRRLDFDDEFSVTGVPGPFVVVSTRPSLAGGVSTEMGDLTIGPLDRNSGAQSYEIPPSAGEFDYVWVYCQPFTVEVARALLVAVP